ncbi:hypothetical protein L6452_40879 [Arctium lappa]|uniref:Uncharacterized protein n=1 Tax=Arctium lappa TaxID=4217 RepID=A0ACB8XN98_ARCLA|nr:hypothetical protein L6452_40879 [Arctium lappa]
MLHLLLGVTSDFSVFKSHFSSLLSYHSRDSDLTSDVGRVVDHAELVASLCGQPSRRCEMERQCNDSHSQPIGSAPVINSMNESNNPSQPIGSSPAINSVTQDETQTNDAFDNDEVESGSKKKERTVSNKSTSEIEKLKELVYTLFQEYESSDPGARNNNESVGGSSFSNSGSSANTCSDETEAYCHTIEYDYDVEEALAKKLAELSGNV